MDLAEIRQRIDAGADPNDIRADLGEKLMECLVAQAENLGPLARVHFGIAIDLLPSPWLHLTWAHVDSVCNGTAHVTEQDFSPAVESAPTLDELIKGLTLARQDIRAHQMQVTRALKDAMRNSLSRHTSDRRT